MKYLQDEGPLKHVALPPGTCLFRQGDPGDYAYILEDGEIEIALESAEGRSVLQVLQPGCLFGELALLDDSYRSATAIALTDVLLTVVTPEQISCRVESADPILKLLFAMVMGHFRSEMARWRPADSYRGLPDLGNGDASAIARHQITEAVDLIRLESDLRTALAEEQLSLNYQPIIDLRDGKVVGFEALLRWHSPTRGWVSPQVFISVAEATEAIVPLGKWIVNRALRDLKTLSSAWNRDIFFSINVASRQIEDPHFVDFLADRVSHFGLTPQDLKLEILERSLFEQDIAEDWIARCRALGFPLALDDFGTGYSSLSYLSQYDIDVIKIDRAFVRQANESEKGYKLCCGIANLARALDLTVVAEGIEDRECAVLLNRMGCGYGQGYYFARPMPLERAIAIERQLNAS